MGWAPTSSLIGVLRSFWSLGSPTRPWLLWTTLALKGPCIHLASNYLWMRHRGLINPSKKVLEPLPLRRLWIEPWKMSVLFGLLPHWFNFMTEELIHLWKTSFTGWNWYRPFMYYANYIWASLKDTISALSPSSCCFSCCCCCSSSSLFFFWGGGGGTGFISNILNLKGGGTPKKIYDEEGVIIFY